MRKKEDVSVKIQKIDRRVGRIAGALALAGVLVSPMAAQAAPGHKAKHHPSTTRVNPRLSRGKKLASEMAQAMRKEGRIAARGSMRDSHGTTSYVLRYQSGSRESFSERGAAMRGIHLTGRKLTGMWTVSIGRQEYRSFDNKHWLRERRATPPSALDALGLTPSGLPCCLRENGSIVSVADLGAGTWNGKRVDRLSYSTQAMGTLIQGRVYLQTHSHLPLGYTVKGLSPQGHGSFRISYGGKFTIAAPRS